MPKKSNTPKAPTTKTPKVAKTIEKPPKKAVKAVKATKKADEPKKVTAPKRTKKSETVVIKDTEMEVSKKILEVCMLLDCTGSMSSWI